MNNAKVINIGNRTSGENKTPSKYEWIDTAIRQGNKLYLTTAKKEMYKQWKSKQAK